GGPTERTTTVTDFRSPRRVGVNVISTRRRSPAGTFTLTVRGVAPALGGHTARRRALGRRRPRFSTISDTWAVSPRRTLVSPARWKRKARAFPARAMSTTTPSSRAPHTPNIAHQLGANSGTSAPSRASSPRRPVRAISAGRGRGRGCPPARRRRSRPPAPPPDGAGRGAAALAGRGPSRRRASRSRGPTATPRRGTWPAAPSHRAGTRRAGATGTAVWRDTGPRHRRRPWGRGGWP